MIRGHIIFVWEEGSMAIDERMQAIIVGMRYKTPLLLAESDYFSGIGAEDTALLAQYGWPAKRTEELRGWRDKLALAFKDRTLAKEDVPAASEARDAVLTNTKVWLKRTIAIASNAFYNDPETLDDFTNTRSIGREVPNVIARMEVVVPLCKKYGKAMADWGCDAKFIKDGEALLATLRDSQAGQKVKIADLPEKTQELYYMRGMLYGWIKRMQRAGKSAFATDPVKAARYNLNILYAPHTHREEKPQTQPKA
jgi:hypothetical protein